LLSGLPGGKWNIAHEAVDRHVAAGLAERTAIRWLSRTGAIRDYSYVGLAELTSRFASGLRRLGVGRGDRVFTLSTRVPELYIATLVEHGG
jgi:acetyl-CoA synthetase